MSETSVVAAPQALKVAVVTGGSAGLGLAIAKAFVADGYTVVILGRDQTRLEAARLELTASAATERILAISADLFDPVDVARAFREIDARFGRLDVLVNNIGTSSRGTLEKLSSADLLNILKANLLPTLQCSQTALPMLERTGGVVVNIGSLAAKVGARYLGAYPTAKHALAGMTQQMRLEWKEKGVHVGLLNPGPIRRADSGKRYSAQVAGDSQLPAEAMQPGGGAKVKGIPAEVVAKAVLKMVLRRQLDVMLPAYLRPLVAIGNFYPPLGDWLLLKFTSTKSSTSGQSTSGQSTSGQSTEK